MRLPLRSSAGRESCRWTCRFEPLEARFLLSVSPGLSPSTGNGTFSGDDQIQTAQFDYRFQGDPHVEQLESGSIVTIKGEQTWIDAGDAVVPVRNSSILLPWGMRITSIDVSYQGAGTVLGSGIQLAAAPAAVPLTGEVESSDLGALDNWTALVETSTTQQNAATFENYSLVGYNLGTLRVFPVEYDATEGELTYHHGVSVTVTVEAIDDSGVVSLRDLDADRLRVEALVDNPETLDSYPSLDEIISGPSTTSLTGQYDYVVITSDALSSSFQPLIDQKISRGLTATIMTTESISANYTGTETHDLADKIRHFLSDAYTNWGTQWVLLGGDSELIPQRGVYANVSGIAQDNELPTDQYYACLDGTWNGDGDALWGESNDGTHGDDIDLVSEVYVGRAPVSNTTEVNNFVSKIVNYETTVHPNTTTAVWLGELLNSDKGVYGSYSGIPIQEATLPEDWSVIEHYDSASTWTRDDLLADLNASPHLVNHLGHSNEIYNARLFNSNVDSLTNDYSYFMYSQGCYSGAFDTRDISIAEQHVIDDHGAFGVVMNTRYGWYNAGSLPAFSHYYAMEFWDAVFNEGLVHVGQANQDALNDNFFRVGSTGVYRWIHMETSLFGDPETSFQLEGPAPDTGEIHGTVWDDADADGIYDLGESGMEGQVVFLDLNDNGVRDLGGSVPSTGTPVDIVDNTTVSSNITVSGLSSISDLDVILNITHSYDEDLIGSLTSPSGTEVVLFNHVGGAGTNFTETRLDDEALTLITAGSAPFIGTYRPENPLSAFDGEDPNGVWTLAINDTATYDTGTLDSWSLEFSPDEPSATTDRNGIYGFTALANQSYQVRHIAPEGYFGTSPSDSVHSVTISGGETYSDIDFLVAQQATSPTAEDLGLIDFLELEGVNLTLGDKWYTFESTRGGMMTVEGLFVGASSVLDMTLLDANQNVLADSGGITGGRRLDWNTEASEILFLHLAGDLSDVSLRLANLVQVEGTHVTAYGTSDNDQFYFTPSIWHELTVNGIDYTFKSQDVDSFLLEGGGGTNDTVQLHTSSSDNDVAKLHPGQTTLTGSDFDVTVNDVEEVTVISGGGQDVAHLYDSPGDDTFVGTQEYSDLNGPGFSSRVEGFWSTNAYHLEGGNDVAHLYDSSGNDRLVGRSVYAQMFYPDDVGRVRAKFFPVVHAYSQSGGQDTVSFYDSAGDDTLITTPDSGRMYGTGFDHQTHHFSEVNAWSTVGGFDRAYLFDSPGDDRLSTTPTSAKFVGEQFLVHATRFEDVNVYGTAGGDDRAELFDSSGNDLFVATPTSASFTGKRFDICISQFDQVHAYGKAGGNDVAHLYDSAGNDKFVGYPTYGKLQGTGFVLRAKFFDSVHAYAKQGGFDKAYLYDSSGNDTIVGHDIYTKLYGAGFLNRAKFFDAVYAYGGNGGNDKVYLWDSRGDDRLDAASNWARLTYAQSMVQVRNFDWVNSRATLGGNDVKHIEAIDFVLKLSGQWTSV